MRKSFEPRLTARISERRLFKRSAILCLAAGLCCPGRAAERNLLQNPGFEAAASAADTLPQWATAGDGAGKAVLTDQAHSGQKAVAIPPNTSVEQKLGSVPAGAYLGRCWVKSESEQTLTFLIRDPERPWATYTCAEIRVPAGQWTQVEAFCAVDRDEPLALSLGGVSKEFHPYHGTTQDMHAPLIADDFELIRYDSQSAVDSKGPVAWDTGDTLGTAIDWGAKSRWRVVESTSHEFAGTPIIQAGRLAGVLHPEDGGLEVYSMDPTPKGRCRLVPSAAIPSAKVTFVREDHRAGFRVSSASGDRGYTAWFTAEGLIQVQPEHLQQIQVRNCNLCYGILPSFAGTDLSYTPAEVATAKNFSIPSTQWFVGLADGQDGMLVAVWPTNSQPVSLSATGTGENQRIDALTMGTETHGFTLAFLEHPHLWHREPLKEDWLGDYVPISWQRPFPARWMARLFVSSGGKPSFRDPGIGYTFPIAYAKTRMWGLWFEDWNHYPFYFDGPQTMFHFEKTFIPQGEALIYFLEPAAADLLSPMEVVERALGREPALALLDLDANQLRKLNYSTPDQFMFDRPVCATTTRLSKIKQDEKATIGVDLATHLYEFIREIRGRVDQYQAFFTESKNYLAGEQTAHPEVQDYVEPLEKMLSTAQAQSAEIYATALDSVKAKTEQMKAQLREGKGDGYSCGNLDVRSPAGSQDDLCRRYNRYVIKLVQTAALNCGDSPEKARIATRLWNQARGVLRRPTRWEPRRTLYFFEP